MDFAITLFSVNHTAFAIDKNMHRVRILCIAQDGSSWGLLNIRSVEFILVIITSVIMIAIFGFADDRIAYLYFGNSEVWE
jgi:hypothetical protein